MDRPYLIRDATPADAAIVGRHRAKMFHDMGEVDDADVAALDAASGADLANLLASGEYVGWVAEADGIVVAGAGVMLRRLLPRGRQLGLRLEAYVLNVYTDPAHRQHGLARELMTRVIEWARQEGCVRITLHASAAGKSLYEALGFEPTNEMRLGTDEWR